MVDEKARYMCHQVKRERERSERTRCLKTLETVFHRVITVYRELSYSDGRLRTICARYSQTNYVSARLKIYSGHIKGTNSSYSEFVM